MQAQQVRAMVENNRPTKPNEGYAENVRRAVAHFAAECRAQGQTWADIATAVGVSSGSVANWSKQFPRFLSVTVVEDPSPLQEREDTTQTGLVLHTPAGYTLAGLDLDSAVALLRALR